MENTGKVKSFGLDLDVILSAVRSGKAEVVDSLPGSGEWFYDVPYQANARSFTVRVIVRKDKKRVVGVFPPSLVGTLEVVRALSKATAPAFRAAFDRLAAYKGVTEQDFQRLLTPILRGIANALREDYGGLTEPQMDRFIHEYIANLAHRWNHAKLDVGSELERALNQIGEKSQWPWSGVE